MIWAYSYRATLRVGLLSIAALALSCSVIGARPCDDDGDCDDDEFCASGFCSPAQPVPGPNTDAGAPRPDAGADDAGAPAADGGAVVDAGQSLDGGAVPDAGADAGPLDGGVNLSPPAQLALSFDEHYGVRGENSAGTPIHATLVGAARVDGRSDDGVDTSAGHVEVAYVDGGFAEDARHQQLTMCASIFLSGPSPTPSVIAQLGSTSTGMTLDIDAQGLPRVILASNNEVTTATVPFAITPLDWHDVCGIFDGEQSRLSLRFDEREVEASTGTSIVAIGPGVIRFGADATGSVNFNGVLDDVRVFAGHALTAVEYSLLRTTPVPRPPPHLHFNFEGDVNPSSPEAAYTLTVPEATTFAPGVIGTGLSFDSPTTLSLGYLSSYLESGASREQLTVSMWVRPDDGASFMSLFQTGDSVTNECFQLWLSDQEVPGITLDNAQSEFAAVDIATTGFSHVAATFDASAARIYVDGQLVATESAPIEEQISLGTTGVRIGQAAEGASCRSQGQSLPFAGVVDEVRIYSYAQTESEIQGDIDDDEL